MLNAKELKAALSEEIRIIRHIATKLDPTLMDWRPSEGQRSTLELLRYLASCGIVPLKVMLEGDWSKAQKLSEEFAQMGLAEFDAAMQRQDRELQKAIDELADAKLRELQVKLPWGVTQSMGHAIFTTSFRFLCSYRLQLFLYAKQSGASTLSTADAWMGMSESPK